MKSIGIVREVDSLGRIVIPKELRRTMKMDSGDEVEIFVEGDSIILRNYKPCCIFCGNDEKLEEYEGKMLCAQCIDNIKRLWFFDRARWALFYFSKQGQNILRNIILRRYWHEQKDIQTIYCYFYSCSHTSFITFFQYIDDTFTQAD